MAKLSLGLGDSGTFAPNWPVLGDYFPAKPCRLGKPKKITPTVSYRKSTTTHAKKSLIRASQDAERRCVRYCR